MKIVTNKYSGAFIILLNLNVFFFQIKVVGDMRSVQ